MRGLGETFAPDLQTGTGNLTLPITLPAGRSGFQPELALSYSTGNGNGPAGLGWALPVPGVARKTSSGVPRYRPGADRFLLAGAEDLVPVEDLPGGGVRYRPRTEGVFARIAQQSDHWEVTGLDGLRSRYATPTADPADPERVFAWSLSRTEDLLGNVIAYDYAADAGDVDGHRWDRPVLSGIRWADLPGTGGTTRFLARMALESEPRPDPYSVYTAGFEVRTTLRYRAITTYVVDDRLGGERPVRRYELHYTQDAYTGASLLAEVAVVGFDDAGGEHRDLPPVRFGYDRLDPSRRRLVAVTGDDPPGVSLGRKDHALVDLTGDGLPDVLQLDGVARWWRNRGGGVFDRPRPMRNAPAGVRLSDPGVALLDVQGDGRADLSVSTGPLAGYVPLRFGPSWGRPRRYGTLPPAGLSDPGVRLVDLTGDGVTDAVLLGDRLTCVFQQTADGATAWAGLQPARFDPDPAGPPPWVGPEDDRLRWADMCGDGLTDLVLVRDGAVEYWPSLGHGRFARRVRMRPAPRLPAGYRPDRLLLGDLDGDGCADLAYVAGGAVTVWFNRGGEGWSEPVSVSGVPEDTWDVRIADVLGTGVGGLVFSRDRTVPGRAAMYVLDLTGGVRPRLLTEVDNRLGTLTRVAYASSAQLAAADAAHPATRWRTPLPMPVAVVSRVETVDRVSGSKLTSTFRYAHGYWDGYEREFRGFGRVDRTDTETFTAYHADGLLPATPFAPVEPDSFSPPALTRTWFHLGPVETDAEGEWAALDLSAEFWAGDPPLLPDREVAAYLRGLDRPARRDALRALRGRVLRTEVYAADGSPRAHRPYTVTEHAYVLREEPARRGPGLPRVFLGLTTLERTTQWERGDDPRTRVTATGDHDAYGRPLRRTEVALPRRSARRTPVTAAVVGTVDVDTETVLALHTRTSYALAGDPAGPRDRIAEVHTYEPLDPPGVAESAPADVRAVLCDQLLTARQVVDGFGRAAGTRLIGHSVNHYDGPAWAGLPAGQVGARGLLTRTETLVFTDEVLDAAYGALRPQALGGPEPPPAGAPPGALDALGYRTGPAGWYADTLCQAFDIQLATPAAPNPGRGLVLGVRSPLGHESRVTPDTYWLRPARIRDPAGLETVVTYDYRAGGPRTVTDPNGTTTAVTYHPLGMVAAVAVTGADGTGDTTAAPGSTYTYDLSSFAAAGRPISVHTRRRVWHASDGGSDEVIESREYSDGLGRLVQTRAQADVVGMAGTGDDAGLRPGGGAVPSVTAEVADRVAVSGWQLRDNKGQVVASYEPLFGTGWDYQPGTETARGRREISRYDPLGRQTEVLRPDGSRRLAVHGVPADLTDPHSAEPSPWTATAYDENDLASESAAPDGTSLAGRVPAALHHTPTTSLVDALDRTVAVLDRGGADPAAHHLTRTAYDLQGRALEVVDQMGRVAYRARYDLPGRALHATSLDAGTHLSLPDATGAAVLTRDARGAVTVTRHDLLGRPVETYGRDGPADALTLRTRTVHGDALPAGPERDAAVAARALGVMWRRDDEAGRVRISGYDLAGRVLGETRQVVSDAAVAAGWAPDWAAPAAGAALDPEEVTVRWRYDALGRAVEITAPSGAVVQPAFGRSGGIVAVAVDKTPYIDLVVHNARGQRLLLARSNGLSTRQSYDPDTFRVTRLRTDAAGGPPLQNTDHTYDLSGNLTRLTERTPACGVAGSPAGRDMLDRVFTYDGFDRLNSATGRACADIATVRPLADTRRCGTTAPNQAAGPDLTTTYVETYRYDEVGTLLDLNYRPTSGPVATGWHRLFGISGREPGDSAGAPDNRLGTVRNPGAPDLPVTHDDAGNLLALGDERRYRWDYAGRLVEFTVSAGAATSVRVRHLYGADGTRVKTWVSRGNGGVVEESTVYAGAVAEVHRWSTGGGGRSHVLHVLDDTRRIASVRTGDQHPDDAGPAVRHELTDHLGSASVIVDGRGAWVNREEYFPYGETSFGSFARKRYRFAGMHRDAASGLYLTEARAYDPSWARWISADRSGPADGTNTYVYCRGRPLNLVDPSGMQTEPEVTDGGAAQPKDSWGRDDDWFLGGLRRFFGIAEAQRKMEAAQLAGEVDERYFEAVQQNAKGVEGAGELGVVTGETVQYAVPGPAAEPDALSTRAAEWVSEKAGKVWNAVRGASGEIAGALKGLARGGAEESGPVATEVVTAVEQSHVGAAGQRRVAPFNPSGRTDNCAACTGAVMKRIGEGAEYSADDIEREFAYSGRMLNKSNPNTATVERTVAYLEQVRGLGPATVVRDGFDAAIAPGHYAVFVNDGHVVYGRVLPDGSHRILDGQIARGWPSLEAYRDYLTKMPRVWGTNPTFKTYYFGP
ncbi:SpvB/TcaC N-terminal domain-containing protein [Streptomyces sp. NPDC102383]|uniref:SpvB/TcaC N-terminal domain-containing protein n=1 Tax=Streptomyces sp. NPDC102383 TaxID=3366165 RepID=UPI003806E0E6